MIFRNEEEKNAYNNLADFYSILMRNLIYPVILDGGTLLGAYRETGFCEDDWDDIDLTTFACEWKKVKNLIKEAQKEGFVLKKQWEPKERKTAQLVFKKGKCKIDLMFKDIKKDMAWWTVYKGQEVTYKAVPVYFFAELDDIKFGELLFSRPKNIKGYLKYRYGNWKKKVHRSNYSCYTSDKCIRKSYEEI